MSEPREIYASHDMSLKLYAGAHGCGRLFASQVSVGPRELDSGDGHTQQCFLLFQQLWIDDRLSMCGTPDHSRKQI